MDGLADKSLRYKINAEINGSPSLAVGIDIGTTTVSAAVIDLTNKVQLDAFSTPHDSYIEHPLFSEQSVAVIIEKAESILNEIYQNYRNIVSIGLTGQMHGIVYIDCDGNPVSNLITWQDKRADYKDANGMSVCEIIKNVAAVEISSGYGIATHFYNIKNHLVPENAVGFCSIMDYFAMHLCGLKNAVTHSSVAASFGMFSLDKSSFMLEKLSLLGIDNSFLPKVTPSSEIIGKWNNIPVSIPIGDNQASFLGSVKNSNESLLINIGTGSQITASGDFSEIGEGTELRPLINGKNLLCGSALCGGSAYALLESFFRNYVTFIGENGTLQYESINELALKAYKNGERPLSVTTTFCGTRSDPKRRGSIENIDLFNFTPSALALGVIHGMCDELYRLYQTMHIKKTHIVASGGAVRKNSVLRSVLQDMFGLNLSVCAVKEEAATGVALFSALALGKIGYNDGFSDFINYV